MKNKILFPRMLFILAVLLAQAGIAGANTTSWSGGGGSGNLFWLSTANWNPASIPQTGDSLVFTNTIGLVNSNNIPGGNFNGITFATPSGAFALNGNSVTLANITDLQVVTPETINLPITDNGPANLNLNIVANGVLNLNNVISGTGNLTNSGAGRVNLTGSNTFAGSLVINGGIVTVSQETNLPAPPATPTPGDIIINGGTLQALAGFTINPNRGMAVGPTSGSGQGTISVNTEATTPNQYATLIYGGAITNNGAGTGGLTKLGFGNLVLFGPSTYTGTTSNEVGTLTLDFSKPGAPANNIISSNSPLVFGGAISGAGVTNFAQLVMTNSAAGTVSQTFNGTHITVGSAVIRVVSGSGTANLTLGTLNHDAGGVLAIMPPTLKGGSGSVSTTSTNLNGIIGGWATISDGNTVVAGWPASTNWACIDVNSNIVNYTNFTVYSSGYVSSIMAYSNNILITSGTTGTLTNAPDNTNGIWATYDVNTLTFDRTDSGWTFQIGISNILRLGTSGGILRRTYGTSTVLNFGTGGTGAGELTAGGPNIDTPGDIVLTTYQTDNANNNLALISPIVDNGAGAVTVVKAGSGFASLNGVNSYSGGTYIEGGRLRWNGGTFGSGPIYIFPGGYTYVNGTTTITNAWFISGNGAQQEAGLGAIRYGPGPNSGSYFTGPITLIGDAEIGGQGSGGILGPISGSFKLILGASTTVSGDTMLANTNNSWSGDTLLTARNNAGINTLTLSNSEVIPNGFGKGNVTMQGFSTGQIQWKLNGFNETINGLSTIGTSASCIISNGAASTVSTLTLGDNDQSGTFGGILKAGAGTLALTKIGAGVEILTAANTYTGDTTISNGVLQLTGSGSTASSANININGGTFDVSAANYTVPAGQTVSLNGGTWFISTASSTTTPLAFNGTLKVTSMNTVSPNLTVGTLNLGSGPNVIQPANMPLIPAYPVTFPIIKYTTLTGSAATFSASLPAGYVGVVSNDNTSATIYIVLTSGPVTPSLTWFGSSGGSLNSTWDFVVNDWTNIPAHHADSYSDGSLVTFDSTSLNNVVNLTTTFLPAGVTVTNSASGANATYVFAGTGAISGTNGVTKQGSGKLILDNTGGDSYTGGLSIGSGSTVQVGINDTGGSLGAPGVNVGDNGLLVFNRANSIVISNSISGSGSLLVSNASGASVQISGGNSFSGPATFVTGLTIQPNNNTAFGTTNSGTTIASGSTLDVQASGLAADSLTMPEPIVISGDGTDGNGAIINNGANRQINALQRVTLAADTSVGGSARFDIRGTSGTNGYLSTGGINYNLTKKGGNQVSLANLAVDPALGNVDVQGGTLEVNGGTTGLGNSQSNLTVAASATLQLFNLANPLNKNIIMAGNAGLTGASGTNTVSGPITLNGTINVFVQGRGTLNLNGAISGSGGLTDNGTNTLVLNGINSYSGGTAINDGVFILNGINNNAANTLMENSSQLGFPTVVVGGNGTNVAAVTIENILHPGVSGHPSTFGSGDLFIDGGNAGTLIMDLGSSTTVGSGVNDWLNVVGNMDPGAGSMLVNPVGLLATNAPYTLATYTGTRGSTFTGLPDVVPSAKPSRYTFTYNYDDANKRILLNVTTGAGSMVWSNATGNNIWDLGNTKNWFNRNKAGGSLIDPNDYQFFQGDAAILDDTGAGLGTTLTNAMTNGIFASTVVVDASANYTITGPGKLTGGTSIIKKNTGTLTLNNMVNDFTGNTLISGGILRMDFATNGLSSLGSIPGGSVTITNGGTLDIGGGSPIAFLTTLGQTKQIFIANDGVGGNGAIINNGPTAQQNAFQAITLTANASIGGTNRWDLRGNALITPFINLNGFTLTKTGSNQVSLVNVIITNTGSIVVNGGTFSVEAASVVSNNTITINSGGALGHFRTTAGAILSPITLNGGTITNLAGGGATNDAPITLTANSFISPSSGNDLYLNGVISGSSFGITKLSAGRLVLNTNETYSGNTVISDGTVSLVGNGAISSSANIILSTNTSTVDVSARANTTLTLASGQTLAGIGVVNGTLSNAVGSTVSPGVSSIGILTVTNGNANLRGTTSMDLNKSVSPSNDVLVVSGNVNYGGTLSLNITGTLAGGDNFKLFNAGTYGGAFSSISPATPGAGLTWNTNNLAINGTISVVSSGPPAKPVFTGGITISGTTLSFSATNGSAGGTWTLLGSTNIALPFASWTTVTNGTFDGSGNVSFSGANLINLVKPQTFYLLQTP